MTLLCKRCLSDVCNEPRPRAWSFNLAVQLPSDEAQAHAALTRLHAVLTALADDAKNTLNLDLNLDKCALLLPPGHANPASCFSGMRVSTRGTKVAGAPIREYDFCAKIVQLRCKRR